MRYDTAVQYAADMNQVLDDLANALYPYKASEQVMWEQALRFADEVRRVTARAIHEAASLALYVRGVPTP